MGHTEKRLRGFEEEELAIADGRGASPPNLQGDQREPAWRPARAASAAEMPHNIFHYVLETSGWHQLWLVVLTVAVFLLEIVPLELQRRIVNDLTKHRNFSLIIVLCAVYAGTVLLQGGIKLVLNIYRSWVGERAYAAYTRNLPGCRISHQGSSVVILWDKPAP